MSRLVTFPLAALLLVGACASPPEVEPPAASAPAPRGASATPASAVTRLRFTDVTQESGLGSFRHLSGDAAKRHLVESVGAGVAWIDHDRDGDLDAYLSGGGSFDPATRGTSRDALFRNDGGTFVDVSAETGIGHVGWTMGVTVADYDGDGWPDLFITGYRANALLRNESGRFRDVTREAGIGPSAWSSGAAFFDLDGDGDLDLYVAEYMDYEPGETPESTEFCEYRGVMVSYGPRGMRAARDRVYEQVSPGRFRDVTRRLGVDDPPTWGFQPVAFDADQDGDTDLFVANDSVANYLWVNDGGKLADQGMRSGLALRGSGDPQACMGVALGDLNGDGLLDILVTNFSEDYNTAYRNDGRRFFTDATHAMALAEPAMPLLGWGCVVFDPDLDGDQDVFVANGHVYPQIDQFQFGFTYLEPCLLMENTGQRFADVSAAAGPGVVVRRAHRGLARGDFDEDGDDDLLIGVIDGPPVLLRNDTPRQGHWLAVRLQDPGGVPDGIGARVVVEAGGRRQAGAVVAGTSFMSSDDTRLRFGLGTATRADAIEVHWPRGGAERFGAVDGDQTVTLVRGAGTAPSR